MELSTYKADEVTKQPGIPDPKEQILSLLKSADSAREDVNKSEEWRLLQKVREFVYSLRFPEQGFSKWRPLFAAGGCAIVLALCLASSTRKTHYYHYPENYLRVIQNLDPCLSDGSCGYRFAVSPRRLRRPVLRLDWHHPVESGLPGWKGEILKGENMADEKKKKALNSQRSPSNACRTLYRMSEARRICKQLRLLPDMRRGS